MRKLIIGLIGQVCAGKSAVADAFRRRGCMVWDADRTVHELYQLPDVISEVVALFGTQVLDQRGGVERKALARIVFSDPVKLDVLTRQVIFPRTAKSLEQALARFGQSAEAVLLLDAPTLVEAGHSSLCDYVLYVVAPPARRLQWAAQRGWDQAELRRRDENFDDDALRRARADVVLENTGSIEDLDQQVGKILVRLTAESAASGKGKRADQ